VEARLSTGEPIVVPFTNHASFETSVTAGSTSAQTQFTTATQSLNKVIGSARFGNYDSGTIGVPAISSAYYTANPASTTPYYAFNSMCAPQNVILPQVGTQTGTNGGTTLLAAAPGQYQLTIDSKVFPQFMADVGEAYNLSKNAFDGSGGNKAYAGQYRDLYTWSKAGFMLAISLDHNQSRTEEMSDRLISGLNTNGSNIPIVWNMSNVCDFLAAASNPVQTGVVSGWGGQGIRPIVFTEMTSTLLIYPGRVISVIN
jgi:hypothetical protein